MACHAGKRLPSDSPNENGPTAATALQSSPSSGNGKTCGCRHHAVAAVAAPVEVAPPAEADAAVAVEAPPEPQPGGGCGCGHHATAAATATTETVSESTPPNQGQGKCGCRRLLWIRKVHSAAGILLLAFLLEHLAATALGARPALAGRYLQFLQAALAEAPWLAALIFVPLAVAAGFGGYLLLQAGVRYNVKKCNRGGKLRYWLQRTTAVVLLVFLALHIGSLRGYHLPTTESAPATFHASVAALQAGWPAGPANPWRLAIIAGLLLGTWAAAYHASNGLWTAAIAWGLLETPAAQRRAEWVCGAAGLGLAFLGTIGWAAFAL